MDADEFWKSHGIERDPFASQDAAQDYVLPKCLEGVHHPQWDRILGDPSYPTTSLVFGEKGSGKTAIRLQILKNLAEYNESAEPGEKILVIEYEDFNPILDTFAKNLRSDSPLSSLLLQDHIDAILSIGVTKVVNNITAGAPPNAAAALKKLDDGLKTDFALLTAIYDSVERERFHGRWYSVVKKMGLGKRLRMFLNKTLPYATPLIGLVLAGVGCWQIPRLVYAWVALALVGFVHPIWRCLTSISRSRRILQAMPIIRLPGSQGGTGRSIRDLAWALRHFSKKALDGRVLPNRSRDKIAEEARYHFLRTFQTVLKALGFSGIVVLIDRIDEPTLVAGDPEKMWFLMRNIFDNKLLKHPDLGIKALLQIEVWQYIKQQGDQFRRKARLDKQHVVAPLEWTSKTLYDVAAARLDACRGSDESSRLDDLFDDSVKDSEAGAGQSANRALLHYFDRLRPQTPRNLFDFLHEVVTEHCNRTPKSDGITRIDTTTLAVAFERLTRSAL
ncbi:MAG: hypothetical protein GXP25_00215 [Planctomycetes bacterium]|nr:hypothetical protein [Planctomycetota bacterium]